MQFLKIMPSRGTALTVSGIGRAYWKMGCDWRRGNSYEHTFTIMVLIAMALTPGPLCWAEERTLEDLLGDRLPALDSIAAAVQCHMTNHQEWQQISAVPKAKPEHRVLVMTWFLRSGRIALFYTVSDEGKSYNVRSVYNVCDGAEQDSHKAQLSDKTLADLRTLLSQLPKSKAKPPIAQTVVLSFKRDGKWSREVYDSTALPETVEKIMLIVGERFETKDRKRQQTQ